MNKPIIGLFVKAEENIDSNSEVAYVSAIEKSGGIAIVLPYDESEAAISGFVNNCDGFFFTGGADISPTRYGELKGNACGIIEYERDEFEFRALEKIIKTKKPVLGICRGMQVINVALGGTLHQDIPSGVRTKIAHRQTEPEFADSHRVNVVRGTPLYGLVKKSTVKVNSFHHQCIKALGEGLSVMATADDGIIEAVYLEGDRYLRAYQWHPERLYFQSKENRAIFEDFINVCALNAEPQNYY